MRKPGTSFLTPINVIMLTVLIDMTGFGIIIPAASAESILERAREPLISRDREVGPLPPF